MLADVQTNNDVSDMHAQWFSCWKIKADDHDVMTSQVSLVLFGREL